MPHTKSRYMQDLGFPDARISLDPQQELIAFGTTVLTRTAAGNINYTQGASQTVQYTANITAALARRTGFFEDLQEQFGGAGIPGSAEYQGRPDTLGSMSLGQPITPRTAFKVKGVQLNSFDVIYQISGAVLTAHTCQANVAFFQTGQAAPTITNVLASAANGLTTATGNIQVINVPLPLANQNYLILPDQDLWVEVNVQTGAGGSYVIWGIDALVTYNYN